MKHNLRCIGRLVRVRNGKLVTQRKVWAEVDVPFFVQTVRRFRKRIAPIVLTKEDERYISREGLQKLIESNKKVIERWKNSRRDFVAKLKKDDSQHWKTSVWI